MQLSDWNGLSADERDSFVNSLVEYGTDFVAPLYSVVEKIEETLQEKNSTVRAQADARPVGFVEQWEFENLKKGAVARLFPTNDEQHDVAVYTHPEASAPGLSPDWLWVRLMDYCKAKGIAPANANDLFAIVNEARALTHYSDSAATVGEPSAYEHVTGPRVPEIDRVLAAQQQAEPSELEMHRADYQAIRAAGFHDPGELLDAYKRLQAAQQQTNQGASHEWDATGERCLKCGDKDWFAGSTCSGKAAQQQAEPGADERAAFEAWFDEWFAPSTEPEITFKRDVDDDYIEWDVQCAWRGWEKRASQSGQRAGVPIEAVAKAYGYLWHVNEMNADLAPFYPPAKAAYAARKVLREFLTHEQRGEAINEAGLEIGRYVDESDRAAAPTQQQEGGK